ncbi:Myb-like DNA-binding domain containing protein [Trichomonas vaginalis G3]|uniref:Myb-like DNA-binding domain containing protein n=1 Tax=Trichomonas vaginalis (strain ATCC PRA-98 / G3) TaxID=412133 RepID=A2ET71_TRIV3|nr:RNA polymerase II transcription regulator recruiting protein [Trichomonas vaginalis G3]EAY04124.1 Myb-like DNA-binding domain containing protein [Trichomonas vaginalis G3]KAI5549857.1 RNA polymerase II transcription regulator recruiting protein [Trichomonas vaginalis G3]|eukprot:XP_001316347.1 Myb-like DNA-binding domain containing protein [Trichomonas vaginalis G3]
MKTSYVRRSRSGYRKNAPKNKFTLSEDNALRVLVEKFGESNWDLISNMIQTRNSRQCRDRWEYYLAPKLNKNPWSEEEDKKLIHLIRTVGPHWVKVSKYFDGRTDTQIKNRWNILKRKLSNEKYIETSEDEPKVKQVSDESCKIPVKRADITQQIVVNNNDPIFGKIEIACNQIATDLSDDPYMGFL